MDYENIKIERPNHDTVILRGPKTVVIDPFKVGVIPEVDLVLITHDHFDHFSPEDLAQIIDPGRTALVGPESCLENLMHIRTLETEFMVAGNERVVANVLLRAVPAYNINKFKAPGEPFHPREAGYLGYIVTMSETKFYHTGDTDFIKEMKNLGPIDVMFVPISGTYVMTVDEAVEAVKAVKPRLAIPMHYGAIVGDRPQAEEFKRKLYDTYKVEIL